MRGKRVILTGAAGGIGGFLAAELLAAGASITLTDLNEDALLVASNKFAAEDVHIIAADITVAEQRQSIIDSALEKFGGVDVLINSAGISPFGSYAEQNPEVIEKTIEINTIAPMMLTHAILPSMLKQGCGQIINIGSTFGSIGFAWFSAYSASKFALRGFSQSLRRELMESGIDVTYIAPRAVKTTINSQAVYDMAKVVKMNMDKPEYVAKKMLRAIQQRKKECYIGFPESLFARLNGILPGIVDSALRKQNKVAQQFVSKLG